LFVSTAQGQYVNVNLTNLVVTDNCDTNPYTSITVYSDELPYKTPAQGYPLATITRKYDGDGRLTGWTVR
jgi:hypothetical protein